MAKDHDNKPDVVLAAHVRAHMLNGEAVDLLPFRHEGDVRSEVKNFIEDWAKTGFLLRDNLIYPWPQVRLVEVTSVESLPHDQALRYSEEWNRDADTQQAFWKTVQPQPKKEAQNGGKPEAAH